jgi:hypothetical protein
VLLHHYRQGRQRYLCHHSSLDCLAQEYAQKEINKKINQEHKINQDDKDSVVESNRLLLNKLHSLESKLKDLKWR